MLDEEQGVRIIENENVLILYSRFFYEKPVFQSVWSYDDRIYFPGDK